MALQQVTAEGKLARAASPLGRPPARRPLNRTAGAAASQLGSEAALSCCCGLSTSRDRSYWQFFADWHCGHAARQLRRAAQRERWTCDLDRPGSSIDSTNSRGGQRETGLVSSELLAVAGFDLRSFKPPRFCSSSRRSPVCVGPGLRSYLVVISR